MMYVHAQYHFTSYSFLFRTDGNYASLRRQLNIYGFLKRQSSNGMWGRKGGLFHRDRPQDLEKIKPRPRADAVLRKSSISNKTNGSPSSISSNSSTSRRSAKKKSPAAASAGKRKTAAAAAAAKTSKSNPPRDFPKALHRFLEECSASHPYLVGWNSTGTAFYVEILHPETLSLLKTYFPGTCLQCCAFPE